MNSSEINFLVPMTFVFLALLGAHCTDRLPRWFLPRTLIAAWVLAASSLWHLKFGEKHASEYATFSSGWFFNSYDVSVTLTVLGLTAVVVLEWRREAAQAKATANATANANANANAKANGGPLLPKFNVEAKASKVAPRARGRHPWVFAAAAAATLAYLVVGLVWLVADTSRNGRADWEDGVNVGGVGVAAVWVLVALVPI
jgi:hypothetical protein